jgi:hypothetical protein
MDIKSGVTSMKDLPVDFYKVDLIKLVSFCEW